ncbi:hypothetical protein D3C86_2013230 [compost metagenome]
MVKTGLDGRVILIHLVTVMNGANLIPPILGHILHAIGYSDVLPRKVYLLFGLLLPTLKAMKNEIFLALA